MEECQLVGSDAPRLSYLAKRLEKRLWPEPGAGQYI